MALVSGDCRFGSGHWGFRCSQSDSFSFRSCIGVRIMTYICLAVDWPWSWKWFPRARLSIAPRMCWPAISPHVGNPAESFVVWETVFMLYPTRKKVSISVLFEAREDWSALCLTPLLFARAVECLRICIAKPQEGCFQRGEPGVDSGCFHVCLTLSYHMPTLGFKPKNFP